MKNARDWFYRQSFHGIGAAAAPKSSLVTEVAPSIERSSGGRHTVHGGEFGPVDRFGLEAAERTFAAIVAARGAR